MLLAIDTATRLASVALYDEHGVRGETTWAARENHTTSLMPEIVHLLARSQVSFEQLSAIAASLGPGSFTGLRVGLSLAKGLAVPRNLAIVGIPTLEVVAYAARDRGEMICAVLDAGRGRWAAATYARSDSGVRRAGGYFLGKTPELLRWAQAQADLVAFSGELTAQAAVQIAEQWPEACVLSPAVRLRRAGFLAELAWHRLLRGETDDLPTLVPFYVPTESVPGTLVQ